MVGDRGLLTSARIDAALRPAGLDWITALRAPAIKALVAEGGPLQPSLFDDRDPRLRGGRLWRRSTALTIRANAWCRHRRHRASLQKPLQRGAGLPVVEDRRSGASSGLPLDRAPGARARAALHAGLLSGMAHAPEPGAVLFDEPDPAKRDAQRSSPVAKATPSPAARHKAASKHTGPGEGEPLPVHSFRTLLNDRATLTRDVLRLQTPRHYRPVAPRSTQQSPILHPSGNATPARAPRTRLFRARCGDSLCRRDRSAKHDALWNAAVRPVSLQ